MFLTAGDRKGIDRLVQYLTRYPFSLSRLVKVTGSGQVVYKAQKHSCQDFPDQKGDAIVSGPRRNLSILSPPNFRPPPPQTGHAARSGEAIAFDSLLWMVLQQGEGRV